MNRRDFLKVCFCLSCCSLAGYGIYDNFKASHKKGYLDYVEIPLAQHCNLNCKYCLHFACIAKKEIYNVEKYAKDIEQLSFVTRGKLLKLNLMGGEPLLHPRLDEILSISRNYFPETFIYIVTNGLLLDSLNKKIYKSFAKNNIALVPSIYNIDVDWTKIRGLSEKYGFALHIPRFLNSKNVKSFAVKSFRKMNLDLNGEQDTKHFNKCIEKFTYMYDGKLYTCPIIANIQHFNNKFNKNLVVTEDDFLDLYNTKDIDEIFSFLKSSKPFCKYCGKTTPAWKNEPWSNSDVHDITEWT